MCIIYLSDNIPIPIWFIGRGDLIKMSLDHYNFYKEKLVRYEQNTLIGSTKENFQLLDVYHMNLYVRK